jgi:hypothetical protein
MKNEKTLIKTLMLILLLAASLIVGQSFSNYANSQSDEGPGGEEANPCRCHYNDNSCESGNLISFRAKCICTYSHCVTY